MGQQSNSDLVDKSRIDQLERIDRLRELGVGDEIKLPQLVVVGDQSSGKSSLLEGISGLPFPVASELCTRFATQIVFRRCPETGTPVQVSIIPAVGADVAHRKKLADFKKEVASLTGELFAKILDEARECMGLPLPSDMSDVDTDSDESAARFSNDILKIEIAGPEQHQFSVVDVPGLFRNKTKYQTMEDAALVRALVESYVKDARTIILAVMDARLNLSTQEIFIIAKAADPEGRRTVGILTKCDLVPPSDAKGAVMIAKNQSEILRHGWYCVRNRSTEEIEQGITIKQRHDKERAFFATQAPFHELDKNRVCIGPLKKALGNLLGNHVATVFPEIRREIEVKLCTHYKKLEGLGPSRQTTHEQLQHLLKHSGFFQQKVENALMGRYSEDESQVMKLRMIIRNLESQFAKEMSEAGHTYDFCTTDESFDGEDIAGEPSSWRKTDSRASKARFGAEQPLLGIYRKIRDRYTNSRGTELPGLVNPAVLEALFALQTMKWDPMAKAFLDEVIESVLDCLDALFETTFPDEDLRNRVRSRVDAQIQETFDGAKAELTKILRDERTPPLHTDNHYFADTLATARADRVVAGLKTLGLKDGGQYTMNYEEITSVGHLSNETSAVHDIHDALKAYYKVALKRFVDNVANQVIERQLLKKEGPVAVFSPEWVGTLSSNDLSTIAGESFETANARSHLKHQIGLLEEARKICAGKDKP